AAPSRPTWRLNQSTDEMTGAKTRTASLRSASGFNLSFPYQGQQHASLLVRKHPRHGLDAIISIERGQLQCGISDGCKLQVRFDDGAPQMWTFVEPESRDSTILFVRDGASFARKLEPTKRLRVELKFFQQNPEIAEFETQGFQLKSLE